ncbi:MAG: putative manganese-dependent inorganic pyrophosphatase [Candidatus Methanofastidiosum methylothiophilum]|uniref:Putative manganese-dependent inorganic pyrophosphatase n=1 Tax=Candidatus Methanofastidiosum methylothiophilum TaxID=1705564 RepID=A0A150IT04_9EURY|nr:MAG: putative manganese-dependent inorganic pyrophosphatase [Candidatus Methanofastidiosum methylthiophilus]KYC48052.1 MAG: putative manganese-dependent inorganic pyrophosphatase [Candidatus Methanofastidiosum methylthiophilus]KYC50443.1 MAG: putative manganese-dependent inorganic pyrophosphatase [Candidatus Methanofastidiosum methylthiophilus]
MTLIFGAGKIGYAVALVLKKRGKEVVVIDKNMQALNRAESIGCKTYNFDFTKSFNLIGVNISKFKEIIITTSDHKVTIDALKISRELNKEALIIINAPSSEHITVFKKLGADFVVTPDRSMAQIIINQLELSTYWRNKDLLKKLLEKSKSLAIVMHDNPDPDAMSSAYALKTIAESMKINADIYYGGEIGHEGNKMMVELLKWDFKKITEHKKYVLREYDKVALIDMPNLSNTTIFPSEIKPDIIIDHHYTEEDKIGAEFVDIRPKVGATATIMTSYLRDFGIEVNELLATGLMYGILVDTNNFKRNFEKEDTDAVYYLKPRINKELLNIIENPNISSSTLDVLSKAINNKKIYDKYVISNVGYIEKKEALSQSADLLLKLEGITVSLVIGIIEDHAYISARSRDQVIDISRVITKTFSKMGSAGGHMNFAAAKISLGAFSYTEDKEILARIVGDTISEYFFKTLKLNNKGSI